MSEERVTVWRMEYENGYGPYCVSGNEPLGSSRIVLAIRISEAHWNASHPATMRDGLPMAPGFIPVVEEGWKHGCPSLRLLDEWFDGWIAKLNQLGCRTVAYSVPASDVRYGVSGKQVLFNSKTAIKVAEVLA